MAVEDDNAMLIPQQLIAWTPDTDKTNTNKGAYLAVKVNITTKDGARVYPSVGEYDWVAVAVNTKWEPGQKYVYTLDFSNGAGKVDPEKPMPGPTDPFKPGEDVLGSAINGYGNSVDVGFGECSDVIDKLGSGGVGPQRLAVCPKV